jgi:outer membrane protein OmpA-like peptidoglycan-associated protein
VDLVSLLANDSAKGREIILVGHTDAKGDADYNLRLSQSRAMVVKEYLLKNGYRGTIRAEGRGEEQPYEPDDKSAYSEAERDQMSRRVELIRR